MIRHSHVWGYNLSDAYHQALLELNIEGHIYPCSDWGTTQKEISITIEVERPLVEPMISKCFIGGPRELEQYRMEMLDGILDFEVEKGNWAYTYHKRYADQLPFIISELKRNPDSRRAVMLIRDNSVDMGSDDPACLQHIQYFIRDGELHCYVLFRSNDACKATFMNMFALILLQKRVADALGVEMGHYFHTANSFHCYEKDLPLLENYCKLIQSQSYATTSSLKEITYDYIGDWDELMEEERPSILKQVEELKQR